jgi:hypothetical protein
LSFFALPSIAFQLALQFGAFWVHSSFRLVFAASGGEKKVPVRKDRVSKFFNRPIQAMEY